MERPDFKAAYQRAHKDRASITDPSPMEFAFRFKDRNIAPRNVRPAKWKTPFKRDVNQYGKLDISSSCQIGGCRMDIVQSFHLSEKGWEYTFFDMDLLPLPEEALAFAREVLERFDQAIQKQSFREFHESISSKWKRDVSVRQMDETFRGFWEKKVRFPSSAGAVVVQQPTVITDDISSLAGYLDIVGYRAWFHMKLTYDPPGWKLYGIDVVVKDPKASPPEFVKTD
jgi:hypothetical protein